MFERISDHLYLYRDICNVYVLKDAERAVLIDFGTGAVLDRLGEIGVGRVDWVLHTHHHRDQCQGDGIANRRGIPVAVPAHERPYFDEVEVFWGSRQIYNVYNVRQTFFTLAESIRVDRSLCDYETFSWGPYRLFVQPAPGHTLGHVALLAEVDGANVAFTGDLVRAPGRVHALYDLQYGYGSPDGCDFMIYSLAKLRRLAPALACPSHGDPFRGVDRVLAELETRLREYLQHRWGLPAATADVCPCAVSPHLLHIPGCSNTWVVVSDSGNALFVDYGCQSGTFMYSGAVFFEAGNRLRMLEHNLDLLREQFGVRKIDVAMPSHYHDDHVNGLPFLQRRHGTRIWCYRNMVDILRNPHAYKLGCVFAEPLSVDRPIDQAETFRWEEFEFQVFHAPGHADYHMAMFGAIDGARVAFSGDEVGARGDGFQSNNIWRNHVHAGSHRLTGRLFLDQCPELTCPGHGGPFRMTEAHWKTFRDWCDNEEEHWARLAPGANVEQAVYPDYVFLYPYQPPCAPGCSVPMQVWYQNIFDRRSTLEFRLVLPAGWEARPSSGSITVPPGEKGAFEFILSVPGDQAAGFRRRAFTLDAVIDGAPCGQLAEAVVDLRPDADWARLGR